MKSVDVFRGFSLVIVIFANYGAGGYSSLGFNLFKHVTIYYILFQYF